MKKKGPYQKYLEGLKDHKIGFPVREDEEIIIKEESTTIFSYKKIRRKKPK